MKILITLQKFSGLSGTELFTRDLAVGLRLRGHNVFIYSPVVGDLGRRLQKQDFRVTDKLEDFRDEVFDIIHAQHNVTAILARSYFPLTPMIFMSHGFIPELEQPPSVDIKIARFVVISDEIKKHLKSKYQIPEEKIIKIYNSVDLNTYRQTSIANKTPKRLLVLSNHLQKDTEENIKYCCKKLGLKYYHVGLPYNSKKDINKQINNADIVITLGRGVLEAIACGRNVIVYDLFGADGLVTDKNFKEIRLNNFSGRRYGMNYDREALIGEIGKYDTRNPEKLGPIIKKDHDLEKNIEKLIMLYKEIINEKVPASEISSGEMTMELNYLLDIYKDHEQLFYQMLDKDRHIKKLEISLARAHKELSLFRKAELKNHKKPSKFADFLSNIRGRLS